MTAALILVAIVFAINAGFVIWAIRDGIAKRGQRAGWFN